MSSSLVNSAARVQCTQTSEEYKSGPGKITFVYRLHNRLHNAKKNFLNNFLVYTAHLPTVAIKYCMLAI